MKLLVDMPLSPALAAWLRERGHDAVHAGELGLESASDAEIMRLAAGQGRTIVTADLDYPNLLALARAVEPSVILFRDGEWSDAAVQVQMDLLLTAVPAIDIERSIIVVEKGRIRRRRLPLGG